MKYLTPICLFLVLPAAMAQEMNRCQVGGRSVIQDEPCPAVQPQPGRYRCFVDGVVINSEAPCATIKSKSVLAKEAEAAQVAAMGKKLADAKRLEAADRSNASRRIVMAEAEVAKNLRDPESARFKYSRVSWFSGYPVVCGMVSGRNGFGGYANPVRYYAIDDRVAIDDVSGVKLFDQQWLTFCGPSA